MTALPTLTYEHIRGAQCELARRNLADFCGMIDIPGAPIDEDPDSDVTPFPTIRPTPALHHKVLIEKLEAVDRGDIKRLMVFMPPGSAKSTYASVVFPVWFMGRKKRRNVIVATYASDLARKIGRRARSILKQKSYGEIFDIGLSQDVGAADEWALTNENEFMGGGILSGITGNRADLIVVDDPVKGRSEAESETIRERTVAEFNDSIKTRGKPGYRIVLIQCMVGDTAVLMSDGTQKAVRDVRPGDCVATYDQGRISTSVVNNWKNQGSDRIFAITTTSGTTVRANERHPFLVQRDGKTEWVRLKNLKTGDKLVKTESIGVSGRASPVNLTDASCPQKPRDIAHPTTTKPAGLQGTGLHQLTLKATEPHTCDIGTASTLMNTTQCTTAKAGDALSAASCQERMSVLTGAENSVLTTATTQKRSEGFCATTATLQWDTEKQSESCCSPLSTYEITHDVIADISPDGIEDVFDIEVEGTENFIANGLVSHNTRWHESDLAGQILPEDWNGESGSILCRDGDVWEVLCIPAQAGEDDVLGRKPGEYLWPEWFDEDHWKTFRANPRTWASLYQQRPTPDDGAFFKREYFKRYKLVDLPKNLRKYGTSDYAVTEDGGDATVIRVWGIDPEGNQYLLPGGYKERETSDKWIEAQINLIQTHKPFAWFGEAGVIQKSIEPMLKRRMRERKAMCRLEWLPSIQDKPTRARGAQARAAMGMVYIPEGPDGDDIVNEYVRFPAGRHDDDVDNLSLMGRALDELHPAIVSADKIVDSKAPRDLYSRMNDRDDEGGGFYG